MDLRTRLTKKMIQSALIELMKTKPAAKITIKELCEKAQISRPTFYAHYQDIFDLTKQTEDELIRTLVASAQTKPVLTWDEQLEANTAICRIIYENRESFLAFFGPNGDPAFIKKLTGEILSVTQKISSRYDLSYKGSAQKYAVIYLLEGTYAILYEWLCNGMHESIEEISQLITRLGFEGIMSKRC